jgi:hypothetical protein
MNANSGELMLGWKPAVRTLEGVTLDDATAAMLRQGFVEYDRGEGYAVLKKGGTQFAVKGEKFASEAALAQKGDDIELQIRYDSFALFDTGDLEEAADRIARVITE